MKEDHGDSTKLVVLSENPEERRAQKTISTLSICYLAAQDAVIGKESDEDEDDNTIAFSHFHSVLFLPDTIMMMMMMTQTMMMMTTRR